MKITWLGQSGYLFESEGKRLLLDPFYSDIVEQKQGIKRLMQAPLAIKDLHPDFIFITHNHLDHFDPVALPEIHHHYPNALIIGPESVMVKAKEFFFNEDVLIKLEAGASAKFGPFDITATPAYHGDPFSVGCLIEAENQTIYYSGDTLLTDTLIEEIHNSTPQSIDTIFIIINGRLGNMNLQEAVKVVTALKPKLAIPMHYGMFAENTADPYEFAAACSSNHIPSKVLEPGEVFVLN